MHRPLFLCHLYIRLEDTYFTQYAVATYFCQLPLTAQKPFPIKKWANNLSFMSAAVECRNKYSNTGVITTRLVLY